MELEVGGQWHAAHASLAAKPQVADLGGWHAMVAMTFDDEPQLRFIPMHSDVCKAIPKRDCIRVGSHHKSIDTPRSSGMQLLDRTVDKLSRNSLPPVIRMNSQAVDAASPSIPSGDKRADDIASTLRNEDRLRIVLNQ
jgi:hypothetical protein